MQLPRLRVAFLLFPLVVAWIYMRPAFEGGAFIAGDHPFYLAAAYAVDENLRAHHGILGWSSDNFAGFPVFSPFIPAPLGFLLISLLHGVTGISVPLLYKGMVLLSLAFPAGALWILISRRFDRLTALVAVNLYFLLTYNLVQPLQGSWTQFLGLGFLILLVHYFDLWLNVEIQPRHGLLLVLLILLAALTDAFTWPVLLFLVPLSAVFFSRTRRISGKPRLLILSVCVLSFLLVAGWVALLVLGQSGWGASVNSTAAGPGDLSVRLPTWFLVPGASGIVEQYVAPAIHDGDYARAIRWIASLAGQHLPEFLLLVLSLIGLTWLSRDARTLSRHTSAFLRYVRWMLIFLLLLLIGPWHFVGALRNLDWIRPWDQFRFVVYVNVCLIVLAAFAIHRLCERDASRRRGSVVVVLGLALAVMHVVRYSTYGSYLPLKTTDSSVIYGELSDVWEYVTQHVDGTESRVLYEELEGIGFLDGGYTNLAALSARQTGVRSIVGGPLYTNVSLRRPFLLGQANPFSSASRTTDFMKRWNCSHLVLWQPMIKHGLLEAAAAELVHESPNRLFSVLRLEEYEPAWLVFDQQVEGLEVLDLQNGRLVFHLYNPHPGNAALLRMSYHPSWSVTVNQQPRTARAHGQMIRVDDLPRGDLIMEYVFRPSFGALFSRDRRGPR